MQLFVVDLPTIKAQCSVQHPLTPSRFLLGQLFQSRAQRGVIPTLGNVTRTFAVATD